MNSLKRYSACLLLTAAGLALGGCAGMTQQEKGTAIGAATAAFFVAVFPGNIAHWVSRGDVPGLDSDDKRFARLFVQPVLVGLALWSTRR